MNVSKRKKMVMIPLEPVIAIVAGILILVQPKFLRELCTKKSTYSHTI
jgi:hypothetical protein